MQSTLHIKVKTGQHAVTMVFCVVCGCFKMDKRVEGRSVTPRSGASVGMQGRSPAVNVINITRRPDGGIVNVEMKRQEGLGQEGVFNPTAAAAAALPSRGTVPISVYGGQTAYVVADQQSNAITKQSPRKTSPNVAASQLPPPSVDSRLDWSDQYQRLMIRPGQRMPPAQHAILHSSALTDQQRVPPPPQSSSRVVPAAVEQQLLHTNAVLSQHAHASDVRFLAPGYAAASPAVPVPPVRVEGTNGGGVAYWAAQKGNDSSPAGRSSAADPKSASVAPQLISRLPGLLYDVIPPRSDGPSEAERKVAVLTQQLENEMRLTASQGSSLRQQASDSHSQYRSPPPYYGPHITANVRMATAAGSPSSGVTSAVVDSDVSSVKSGDVGGHQTVNSLSARPADVDQPQLPAVRQGSDLDASTECYGTLVFFRLCSYL